MSQTQSIKNGSPATNGVSPTPPASAAKPAETKPADAKSADAKPADAKSADAKPADAKSADAKPAEGVEGDVADGDGEAAEKREKRKFFVVVGQVHEFDSAKLAEDFLNGPDAPSDHTVLRGTRTKTNTRISLR